MSALKPFGFILSWFEYSMTVFIKYYSVGQWRPAVTFPDLSRGQGRTVSLYYGEVDCIWWADSDSEMCCLAFVLDDHFYETVVLVKSQQFRMQALEPLTWV